jgi:hypothetical protein
MTGGAMTRSRLVSVLALLVFFAGRQHGYIEVR